VPNTAAACYADLWPRKMFSGLLCVLHTSPNQPLVFENRSQNWHVLLTRGNRTRLNTPQTIDGTAVPYTRIEGESGQPDAIRTSSQKREGTAIARIGSVTTDYGSDSVSGCCPHTLGTVSCVRLSQHPDRLQLARYFQTLLDYRTVKTRAELAPYLSVGRARMTPVLYRLNPVAESDDAEEDKPAGLMTASNNRRTPLGVLCRKIPKTVVTNSEFDPTFENESIVRRWPNADGNA
jgi:hypothetical protein